MPDQLNITVPLADVALTEAIADLETRISAYADAVCQVQGQLRLATRLKSHAAHTHAPEDAAEQTAAPPVEMDHAAESAAPAETAEMPQASPGEDTVPSETTPPAQPSEEEVLLASLDEADARAIRVLRRLNPDKPLHELIKQLEEKKHAADQAPKTSSRSWFSRKR